MKRYNLSGIYIFDKFPGEEKKSPTCIEDCQEETLDEWLKSKDDEYLRECCKLLCQTLHSIGEQFNIYSGEQ